MLRPGSDGHADDELVQQWEPEIPSLVGPLIQGSGRFPVRCMLQSIGSREICLFDFMSASLTLCGL